MRIKEGNKEKDILNAAINVFAKTGYHDAKMSKIAEVAEVATGSLYVYYKNKEQILQKIFDVVWEKLYNDIAILVKRDKMNPEEKFDSMIDMIFDTFIENTDIAMIIADEQQHFQLRCSNEFTPYFEKFVNLGESIVNEGIKKRVFNQNLNVNILRIFILGAFRDLITEWAINKGKISSNVIRSNIKYLIKHGILNHNNK
jgi:TetR/AcrR family transcriptional regulator, fatty acid metabolism regulator protein